MASSVSSAPVASMIAVPRSTRTSSLSSELSVNSNSEFSPTRKYDPGFRSISTRPSIPVLTTSPDFKSSVTVNKDQSSAREALRSARPETALTPPAVAEITNFSRFCALVMKPRESKRVPQAMPRMIEEKARFIGTSLSLARYRPLGVTAIIDLSSGFTSFLKRLRRIGRFWASRSQRGRKISASRARRKIGTIDEIHRNLVPLSVAGYVCWTITDAIHRAEVSNDLFVDRFEVFQLARLAHAGAADFSQLSQLSPGGNVRFRRCVMLFHFLQLSIKEYRKCQCL